VCLSDRKSRGTRHFTGVVKALREICGLALICLVASIASAEGTKLLRHPDIHGETVVFSYAGDLWRTSLRNGSATRLTAHPGLETFPKFSPDGRWIAFTGQYDGDEQVYVMPADGGEPRQLTFYPALGPLPPRWGYDNQVCGWSPDGQAILFRSYRDDFAVNESRLFVVETAGGLPRALPMPTSGAGAFSPDGKKVLYSPQSRDFRTWKRYEGGWAQDLWVFDLHSHESINVTKHRRTDRDPMWTSQGVFFTSDRDGRLNMFMLDLSSLAVTQLTHYRDRDVRWPSADESGRIVYELDGELFVLEAGREPDRLEIVVRDDGLHRRPETIKVAEMIESFDLSPGGERALFVARGDLFTVPTDSGVVRNLTRSSSAHDREASWSPDGKHIAFISDATGEEELWLVDQTGNVPGRQLTAGNRNRFYQPVWSPDNERIAVSDKEGQIFVADVSSGRLRKVGDCGAWYIHDYSWSPDSRYLAYVIQESNFFRSLMVWEADTGETHRLTDDQFDEFEPAWDPDGDYLYFLSAREFAPQVGGFEWNYVINRAVGIFAFALRSDVPHAFPPPVGNVETLPGVEDSAESRAGPRQNGAGEAATIDFDGLSGRVFRVPVSSDNYDSLAVTRSDIIFRRNSAHFYGRRDATHELIEFSVADRNLKKLADDVVCLVVSRDGKKILVQSKTGYQLLDVATGASRKVSPSDLKMRRVPIEEWETIFDEVWRRFRDFFYVENMHGFDWNALREKYRLLLPDLAHRSDLNYVIGEMIAELNVSHAYIAGGDIGLPERPNTGLLGARFELDENAGRYRIAEIFEGQNQEERYRSPLTEVGVSVDEGDYVFAIDGVPLSAHTNPYALLRGTADSLVELQISKVPSPGSQRSVVVRALKTEKDLRYLAWVLRNRRRVEDATRGSVGYLHIPDMSANGIREFIKWYYGQVRKRGLIVDVRGNLGGNVSQMILERLARPLLSTGYVRGEKNVRTYPWGSGGSVVFAGPMVALINEDTMSDGDAFAWSFQEMGRGPLIGKRTWGGVVGIGNTGPLLDGGKVSVPQFAFADAHGRWVIEGHGVEPDIEVENDPELLIEGVDSQLERAIQEVLRMMEEQPGVLPEKPPDPVKSE
jgi:tricorn protease